MFSLKDKVALVTGASQGIGRDTAPALAQAGAKVAVAARTAARLAELVQEISGAGGLALAVPMDVADAEQVKADRKSTRLNSSHLVISYAVFCLKKKKRKNRCDD